MKASRFTEEQIIGILKKAEAGMKTADVCREQGISEATFYKWKAKYGGLDVSEARRLKRLEEENGRLKRIVADLTVDNVVLKDLLSKKLVTPASKRAAANSAIKEHGLSERRACRLTGLARSTKRRVLAGREDDPLQVSCASWRARGHGSDIGV